METGITLSFNQDAVVIKGNKEDLEELAKYLLQVASSINSKDHLHLDTLTLISKNSEIKELIIEKEKVKMDDIKKLQEYIDEAKYIVFFGGAGVSTDSGIKDFRGKDGLYKEKMNKPPEYMLSHTCLMMDSELFFDYYRNKMNSLSAKPNITHKYLKKLEDSGKLKVIITQNIDGLHQMAGSKNVLEIHGTIHQNYCLTCGKKYDANKIFDSVGIPRCTCGGMIRPKVTLYEEALPSAFDEAIKEIQKADLLIVAGTSLTVFPASSLVTMFQGKHLVIINNDKTPFDKYANLVINNPLKNVFSKLNVNKHH